MYSARRWRWIDADVRPSLLTRIQRSGPWDGSCPSCAEPASGHGGWVWVQPSTEQASLVLDPARRGDLLDELSAHLGRVRERGEPVPMWLCTPSPQFAPLGARSGPAREETTARRAFVGLVASEASAATGSAAGSPAGSMAGSPSGSMAPAAAVRPTPGSSPSSAAEPISRMPPPVPEPDGFDALVSELSMVDLEDEGEPRPPPVPVVTQDSMETTIPPPSAHDPDAGVPQMIGADTPSPAVPERPPSLGAYVADLTLDETVTVAVQVSSGERDQWESARLSARPIHLRGRGYPLVGVRIVGSYMGQVGCIDGVVDVGSTLATDIFRRLSERFAVTLRLQGGSGPIRRSIVSEDLEPNAALCIESARGILARGEYPPEEFGKARRVLETEPAQVRLAPPEVTITTGAYQHIIGAREAVGALEHLERVSQKDTLARLLEVDGLPMAEYDAIRRRVLEGSLSHGLCAPRRFWRRLVASGLARDLEDYARRLAANRAEYEGEEGDLDPEASHEAWLAIDELCRRKDIPAPPELRQALDLPEPEPASPSSSSPRGSAESPSSPPPPPRRFASGEIRSGEITSGTVTTPAPIAPGADRLGERLRDPDQRLRAATEVLQGRASPEDLDQVIDALEEFETSELLALLPDLSDLGLRVVPGLIAKLSSESREVRQAATILLGMSREPGAMQRLSEHLVREPTTVWLDVARALGWFGTAAIRSLCQLLHQQAATPHEPLAIDRVSRALAEIAVAQDSGTDTQTGRDAVRALAEAADPRVSTAARRAMASLAEVTSWGAQIRGEIPLREVTEIRAFARSAYEAIMVPELEVEAEA